MTKKTRRRIELEHWHMAHVYARRAAGLELVRVYVGTLQGDFCTCKLCGDLLDYMFADMIRAARSAPGHTAIASDHPTLDLG